MAIRSQISTRIAAAALAPMLAFGVVACGNDNAEDQAQGEDVASELSTVAESDVDPTLGTQDNAPADDKDGAAGGDAPAGDADNKGATGDKADAPAAGGADNKPNPQAGGDANQPGGGDNAPAGGGTGDAPSIGDVEPADITPIEDGKKGSRKEEKQIREMLSGIYKQDSVLNLGRAMIDNTCNELIEAQGGRDAFVPEGAEDIKFADMGIDVSKNEIVKVENLRTKDGRATADVTARTQEGESTSTVAFKYEDNRWKVCSA